MTFLQQKLDQVTSSFKCFQNLSINKSSVPYKICKIHHLAQLSFFFNFQLTFYSDLNYMLKLYFVIVAQLCPTLCDPMDCSPSDFSLHGDFPGKNALLHKLYFTTFKIGNPMFCLPCILWHMTVFLPVWDLLASYLLCCFLTATTKFLFLFFFNWWFTLFFWWHCMTELWNGSEWATVMLLAGLHCFRKL